MDAWPVLRERWTEQGRGKLKHSSSAQADFKYDALHIWHFAAPHGNRKRHVPLFHYFPLYFKWIISHRHTLDCFSFYQHLCDLPSFFTSLHLSTVLASISLFNCLFFSSIVFPSLPLCLAPWGHWGQAQCRGLVDEYHVRLFHVFSGRATVDLLLAFHHRAALLSAPLKVYLHF